MGPNAKGFSWGTTSGEKGKFCAGMRLCSVVMRGWGGIAKGIMPFG